MKSEQIVSWLRDKAARAEGWDYRKMLTVAAEKIVELETELREEMHRHDRLQDFEVAEAQLLAEYKNTGLTPDQVAFLVSPDMQEMAQLMKECLEMIQGGADVQIFGLPAERVMELVEQEKAGGRTDAVELVHGRWQNWHYDPCEDCYVHVCSKCGGTNERMKPYCPNCGAKMDGGEYV